MTVSLSQLSAKASASQHNATSSNSSVNDKPLQGCDQQPDTQTNDLGTYTVSSHVRLMWERKQRCHHLHLKENVMP